MHGASADVGNIFNMFFLGVRHFMKLSQYVGHVPYNGHLLYVKGYDDKPHFFKTIVSKS